MDDTTTLADIDGRIAATVERVRDLLWVSGYDAGDLADLHVDDLIGWRCGGHTLRGIIEEHVWRLSHTDGRLRTLAAERLEQLRRVLWALREERWRAVAAAARRQHVAAGVSA